MAREVEHDDAHTGFYLVRGVHGSLGQSISEGGPDFHSIPVELAIL